MISKNFDKVKPYCYILTRKSDGKKYLGARWANARFNRTPKEDFGIYYFSSHKELKKPFKKNPNKFSFKFVATFSTVDELREYEVKRNKKLIKDPNWLNTQAFPAIINPVSPFKGKKHTREAKKLMSLASTGRKASKKTLKKLSKAFSGQNNPNYGNKWPSKMKRKISRGIKKSYEGGREIWNKGKTNVYNKKTLKRMSKTKKEMWKKGLFTHLPPANKGKEHPMYGKKHSTESKTRMSIAHKNRKPITKKIRKNISIGQLKRTDKLKISFKGKKFNIKNFCKELGISTHIYNDRIKQGLSLKQIIKTAHYHGHTKIIKFKNKEISVQEFLDTYGISHISWHRWKKKKLSLSQMIKRRKLLDEDMSYFNRNKDL